MTLNPKQFGEEVSEDDLDRLAQENPSWLWHASDVPIEDERLRSASEVHGSSPYEGGKEWKGELPWATRQPDHTMGTRFVYAVEGEPVERREHDGVQVRDGRIIGKYRYRYQESRAG